ncbi:MAG: hypothetical protein P4L90_25200 [Rhodopila sp.]|nr:hypothetical protein [Rhodopila sp.]
MPKNATPALMPVPIVNRRRIATRSGLFTACAMMLGCTTEVQPGGLRPPEVIFDTPGGPVALNGPAQGGSAVPGGNLAMPPAGPDGTLPPPARAVSRNGTYAGTANVLSTGGGMCLDNKPVSNFRVHGDAVRFGEFHGTIAPDGGLQMVFGAVWITGHFEGSNFRGQLSESGRFGSPGCTFLLVLDRVGP